MVVGLLQLSVRLPEANSLKEKRWRLKSFLARARNKFNISASEVGSQDSWQRAVLAIAYVGNDRRHVNEVLDHVLDFCHEFRQFEIIDSKLEFY